jgi:hypothetical protein
MWLRYFLHIYECGTLKLVEVILRRGMGAKCQWLVPVILATQEAEIRRIAVQRQPRQTVQETLSKKKPIKKKGWKSGSK